MRVWFIRSEQHDNRQRDSDASAKGGVTDEGLLDKHQCVPERNVYELGPSEPKEPQLPVILQGTEGLCVLALD